MPRTQGALVLKALAACLVLLLGACASSPPRGQDDPLAGLGQRLLVEYMQPRTRELRQHTTQLQAALAQYCARPDGARRKAVEEQFGDVVAAWAHVEFLRFGPLVEQNRSDNFFFWPDPRGVVQRQMRTVLSGADASLQQLPPRWPRPQRAGGQWYIKRIHYQANRAE